MFDLSELIQIDINDLFQQTFDLSEVIPDFGASALTPTPQNSQTYTPARSELPIFAA